MARRWMRRTVGGVLSLALGSLCSCATAFTGDAQFPGGASACWKKCQGDGMEMASFVYVGEYSTACACKPKVGGAAQLGNADAAVDGAVVAAGAGVEMQRRREAQARAAGH